MSPQYDIELGSIKKRCLYKKGIIFCDLNHKGSMMVEFLKQIKYKPKKIIFVDDKMRNVINVEEAAKKLGIECIAIHYIYLADSNKTFDPELTEPDFSIASSHA
jgi:5S rRNA maturation endonuclease (ribonuclease M5)